MSDQGRFILDGVHFSWWRKERVVTVSSLRGSKETQLPADADPEAVARKLARQVLLDADKS